MPHIIKVGEEEFEEIPREANAGAKAISDFWVKLGKPADPLSDSGQKLMKIMIAVWEDLYPVDSRVWHNERENYKRNELSVSEQVHQSTGRSLASYPLPIYNMMKKVFPGFDAAKRENCIKMVQLFPMFQFAKKV